MKELTTIDSGSRYAVQDVLLMKPRLFVLIAIVIIVSGAGLLHLLPLAYTSPPAVVSTARAAILLPIDKFQPMWYLDEIVSYLTDYGFTVEIYRNEQVTLDFFKTQLANYKVIFWRTDLYLYAHQAYWWIGELATLETFVKYSADVQAGRIDLHEGMIGVNGQFFLDYYNLNKLPGSLVFIEASWSIGIVPSLIAAGAKSVISFYQPIVLEWGTYDSVARIFFALLAQNYTVSEAVAEVIRTYNALSFRYPDQSFIPSITYSGDGAATIYSFIS